jgi:aminopeptidase N
MYIRITVPVGLSAISNGRLIKTSVNNKDWTTYEWYVSYPINNYDVTLNIANYSHFSDVYKNLNFKDTLTLDYFVLPANLEKAKKHFKQVKPMMDCYYQLLGEYPFVRDGYKLVETPYLGMEHQSCISYGNNYLSGYLGKDLSETGYLFDYIIIHESAHEWWGNSITTNDIADMWIHEGFATYTEALYVEYMYGYNAYLKYINSEKDNVKNNKPVIGIYNLNNKGADDMYSKGALLLHTVRSIINDDKQFFEILKGIQDTFRYQTINSKDIENYISQKSGKNFSKIVDVYLRCASIPKLQYTIESDSLNLKIKYRYSIDSACVFANNDYQNKNGLFTMPVKITFKKNYFKIIYPTTLWKTITIYNMKKENFKVAEDLFYMDVEQKN